MDSGFVKPTVEPTTPGEPTEKALPDTGHKDFNNGLLGLLMSMFGITYLLSKRRSKKSEE
ncbi:LPXTG cell wall anchor domain-containing protein [Staphylococcus chromogenes]|uniref:LPXTG cell wall anchor domain-containing protein n=1 Tax=Staphylococcus chromogenes TaxID=46126 RepID=UPI001E4710AF